MFREKTTRERRSGQDGNQLIHHSSEVTLPCCRDRHLGQHLAMAMSAVMFYMAFGEHGRLRIHSRSS